MFENRKKGTFYTFPGFLKSSPNAPCCFSNPNHNIINTFGLKQDNIQLKNSYIQGSNKLLDWDPIRTGLFN